MTLQVWFWIIMALWFVIGLYADYVPGQPYPYFRGARHVLVFILFVIIGWQVFGAPVK